MGSLTPGATYTYTRENGVTYAQDQATGVVKAIGWEYGAVPKPGTYTSNIEMRYSHVGQVKHSQ